jgi:hypothetical protein
VNNNSKSYKLLLGVAAVLVLVAALITGCKKEPSVANGVISEITTSRSIYPDARPRDPTNVFAANTQEIFLSFKVSNFPVGTLIKVEWIYVGGDPEVEALAGKNFVAETQTATVMKLGTGYTNTVYSRDVPGYDAWPKGDYKVVLSVDGEEKGSTTFKVQ